MRRFSRRVLRLLFVVGILASIGVLWLIHRPARHIPQFPQVEDWVFLDQGWGRGADAETRQLYYYTPIGSSLHELRYDWLVHLEMPWGRRRLADPAHLRSYGFVVDPAPTAANPDQLPVGFTRRFDPRVGEALVDLSCAACHTGELTVERNGRRTAVRIDGGPAGHAFATARLGHFVPVLTASLASTYLHPLKFRRFGRKVLGDEGWARGKWRLHEDLGDVLFAFVGQIWKEDRSRLYPVDEGFGRMDGRARLGNGLFDDGLRGANRLSGGAPVRYPRLWDIWKLERTQHDAAPAQPMARNMLEALRAGARVPLLDRHGRPMPPQERYRSSIDLAGLHRIERALQRLRAPSWPEPVLGRIDRARAERGRELFDQRCRHCHGPFEAEPALRAFEGPLRTPSDALWQTTVVPVAEVGTDPKAALGFVARSVNLESTGLTAADVRAAFRPVLDEFERRLALLSAAAAELRRKNDPSLVRVEADLRYRTERLAGLRRGLDAVDVRSVPLATAVHLVERVARARYYREHRFTAAERACADGFAALDLPQAVPAYRARPLAGVWASAPFLHNGSVPTLYQLLSPHRERDERFRVVPGAFDPVQVGVARDAVGDGFWFDTRIEGNSNVGHEFRAGYVGYRPGGEPQYGVIGPALVEEERWALVEYLKLHEDPATEPGRVPPDCGIR